MKKTKLILTMVAMMSVASLTGCSAKVTIDNQEAGTPSITIQTSATENTAEVSTDNKTTAVSMENVTNVSMADIFTEANEDWNYALQGEEELAYLFERKVDESTYKEYATIICQGDKGTSWEYETPKFEVGEGDAVELLEGTAQCIYINEGGTVTAINITDGKVLWQNSDYMGSGSLSELDEDGNLYIAGYNSPALIVIDPNGNTLCKVAQFAEYFWPYEMSIEGNMLTILYDSEDNAKVTMDIRDYSYDIN